MATILAKCTVMEGTHHQSTIVTDTSHLLTAKLDAHSHLSQAVHVQLLHARTTMAATALPMAMKA